MARILYGKEVSSALWERLLPRIDRLRAHGVAPTLAIVRVGERPTICPTSAPAPARPISTASPCVVSCCQRRRRRLSWKRSSMPVNADPRIHGCLMFRPLPPQMDERAVCDRLSPAKDIDGIGSASLAGVFADTGEGFPPATAQACLETLDFYDIPVAGKRVVVLGRSLVIGRPVAMMLLARHATVTLAHSRTADVAAHTREADIVVCATGRARAYGPEYFSPGQTVLDVGINFDAAGNLCGDVDFGAVEPVLGPEGAITPVPRGLGGVTTSVTMAHVVQAAEAGQR